MRPSSWIPPVELSSSELIIITRIQRAKLFVFLHHAPRANAICERFLGSVRRECLDHLLVLHERRLHRILNAYVAYFNQARPHQGIRQQIPEPKTGSVPAHHASDKVISFPALGGLHHDYRRSA